MTQADIVNAALGRLGVDPIGNINDTTKAAKTARLYWSIAIEAVLRAEDWNRLTTSCVPIVIADIAWKALTAYAVGDYAVTGRFLMICAKAGTSGESAPTVYEAVSTDGTVTWNILDLLPASNFGYANVFLYPKEAVKIQAVGNSAYQVFGFFIYTDEDAPVVRFTRKIASVDGLDALLQLAIVAKLAEMLAPSFGQAAIVQQLIQEYEIAKRRALSESADEVRQDEPENKLWTGIV